MNNTSAHKAGQREYDAFEQMCEALSLPRGSLVAVLTAYFDESYNHRTEKNPHDPLIYTVGCWLSTREQWKKYGKKWASVLRSAEIDSFHMTEYECREGGYKYWNEAKRKGVLRRLHRVMKEHILYGCSASVSRADYDEIITPDMWPVFGKTHYGFDAFVCIQLINAWCDEQGHEGPVHYVFADLAKQGNDLDRVFRRALSDSNIKRQLRMNGMWTKGLMRDVVQLQAADIIAYEINKRAVDDAKRGEPYLRKSLGNLYLDKNFDAKFYGREELSVLVSKYKRGVIDTY